MEQSLSSSFSLTEEKIKEFKVKGYLHLKGFFSEQLISHIAKKVNQDIHAPIDMYQSGFSRITFDLFKNDQFIASLLRSNTFRNIMKNLTGRSLIYTQGLGFELKKKESKGFPWHIGTQSFGYQRAEDFGCTIWTPLVPINTKAQRGGMAYVPKNIVSGDFLYTHIDPAVFKKVESKINNEEKVSLEDFVHLRDGPLNDPAMKKILEYFCEEDDFNLGDALIFDKYVIHRSVILDEGEIDSRAAFVMRFVCADSKYDKRRAENLEIPRKYFNYSGPTRFHLDVCENDGDLIAESNLFLDDKDVRILT
jgi:hypothetical protein